MLTPVRPTQFIGFLLWRTGLLIIGSYSLWRISYWVLRYVDLPPELEIGSGLVLTGCGLGGAATASGFRDDGGGNVNALVSDVEAPRSAHMRSRR